MALWALVFFSLLCAGLYSVVSSYASIMKRLEDRILCRYLAKAAYYDALSVLAGKADPDKYDNDLKLGSDHTSGLGSGKYTYRIIGEENKININKAPQEVLARLPGMDKGLAEHITLSKLRPFYVKEEALLVEGISEEKYLGFKDFVTVYGEGKVNVNIASHEVLKALGMSDGLISQIDEFLLGPDGKAGTKDDEAFKSADVILTALKWISTEEKTVILNLTASGTLTAESKVYSLKVNTEIFGRIGPEYDIITDGRRILRWIE
ncbi:MAG: type II secretion system protein GspK [Candidatus Omnitrophica bacterium]|nr:type II secretion system protein GspK [Candidatus Omnitrophota bacterium]